MLTSCAAEGHDLIGSAARSVLWELIVNDHEVRRRLMRSIFAAIGCDVRLAANGVEAIEIATARAFDLMLMDRHMPRYDGDVRVGLIRRSHANKSGDPGPTAGLQIPSAPVAAPDP